MNILITNDDGPNAFGLKLLREAATKQLRSPNMVTIVPDRDRTGVGTGLLAHDLDQMKITQRSPDFYVAAGSPIDVIDEAFLHPEKYLSRGTWDMVLCGVNRGANTGVDCFRSGTVMAACAASTTYGCTAHAFSQEVPDDQVSKFTVPNEHDLFPQTMDLLTHYFQTTSLQGNECWNVNFPAGNARGVRQTRVAHYSRYRKPGVEIVPRANGEDSDAILLNLGWVTVSELYLSLNPPGRF